MTDSKNDEPELTIVGGQPHGKRRRQFRGQVQVPVGLEKAIFHAARDDDFKRKLLADPKAAVEEAGIRLRPSELAMISAVSTSALEEMIDRVVPSNPKNRRFMGLVANAAASLAAGTVLVGCESEDRAVCGGDRPDTEVDGTDSYATSSETDSGSATDGGTGTGGTGGTGTASGTGTPTPTATSTDTVETTSSDTNMDGGAGPDVGGY